jgi:hypothetical protein
VPSFFSYNALVSQRASGYKSTTHALAEIIDNSFDANATEVKVIFLETQDVGRKHIAEILIADNGDGMTPEILQGALQFGNTTNTDIDLMVATKKKGKFGYGLPNASLSQCPCFHVYSWQAIDSINTTYLDLDELKRDESIDIPDVIKTSLPSYYSDLGTVIDKNKGTIVAWKKCDRLSNTRSSTIIQKSLERIGRLFRYSLSQDRKISFHQYRYDSAKASYVLSEAPSYVVPNDPLFLMKNTLVSSELWKESNANNGNSGQNPSEYYKRFAISKTKCLATNQRYVDHCYPVDFEWRGRHYTFELVTSIAELDIQKPGIRDGGSTQVGKFYGEKAKEGNISFVRADREIAAGHFGFYALTEPRHRWWSIEIRFNADADDLLGVHNNKQGIEFVATNKIDLEEEWNPFTAELLQAKEQLWQTLTVKIGEAVKKVFGQVKKQHKEWDLHNTSTSDGSGQITQGLPGGTSTTQTIIKDTDGSRASQFSEEQKELLLSRLQSRFPNVLEESIRIAIKNYDQAYVRGCVIYAESESEQFWSFTTVFDFLIITINTKHEFYQNILHPLRMAKQEEALAAIELFISSLAWEEHTHFRDDREREVLENFRTYTGMHLNRYIKKLRLDEAAFTQGNVDVEEEAVQ